MTEVGIAGLIIIFVNVLCSYPGFKDHSYLENYGIDIHRIIVRKEYKRLVTSGFFHVSWLHLVLNMVTICLFSAGVELQLGASKFLFIYFASLVGGNLFGLFVYRYRRDYRSVGATGAVNGIMFATIALFPALDISFFGLRIPVPGWFYGFGFVLFSIYGISSSRVNIGHESNLAGALTGLLIGVIMRPASLVTNYLAIFALAMPSLFFIFMLIKRPRFLTIENYFSNGEKTSYYLEHVNEPHEVDQQEIDLILEKIHKQGMGSLSKKEKDKLDYYSKIIR